MFDMLWELRSPRESELRWWLDFALNNFAATAQNLCKLAKIIPMPRHLVAA